MLDKKFVDVLKIVADKLKETDIPWFVIGSSNMALQGMSVNPRDLDLICDEANLERIEKLFSEFVVQGKREFIGKSGKVVQDVGLMINGVEIQFIGEKEDGIYPLNLVGRNIIVIKDHPCYPLDLEANCYDAMGRKEKAEIIREFLKDKD